MDKDNPIVIKKPFFKAGEMYRWEGDPWGVGISIDRIREISEDGFIYVQVFEKGKKYKIAKKKARQLYKMHRSKFQAHGTTLAVLPLKDFELIDYKPEEV